MSIDSILARTRRGSRLAMALALPIACATLATTLPTSDARAAAGPPRFFNYVSPPGTADNAGEPSIGVNWNTEHVFNNSNGPIPNGGTATYFGGFLQYMVKVTFSDCQSPALATWEKKPVTTPSTTRVFGDPILFTDHTTGRTFVTQLEGLTPAGSTTEFTDNDGDTFTPSEGSGLPSCIDHETIGGGPFAPPLSSPLYPHAIYYASQCVADATASLSVDGGVTFPTQAPMFTALDCDGLHGHLKVAPDGTVYVPDKQCAVGGVPLLNGGNAAAIVSENNGLTWSIRPTTDGPGLGEWDPSIGIATDGTVYLGYQGVDGHARIAVSHNKGVTWLPSVDVGIPSASVTVDTPAGIKNVAFPAVVAGDPNRAAFAFYGTTTADGPGEDHTGGPNNDPNAFTGVWYLYIATTFDGGLTWNTQNVTPGDPIQRGPICGGGNCRNMLDFFDITIDKEGRVLVGWDDGCIGGCVDALPNSNTAKATITRQCGGKRMFAAFDPVEPRVAEAPGVTGTRSGTAVTLSWPAPDNGGAAITGYRIYRSVNGGSFSLLASPAATGYVDQVNASDADVYRVTAVNALGEGPYCSDVVPGTGPTATACTGIVVSDDVNPDGTDNDSGANTPPDPSVNIKRLVCSEPYLGPGVNQVVFSLQLGQNGTLTPSSQWYIIWDRTAPAADGSDRRFVAMKTDAANALSFVYGDFGPPLDPLNPAANANTPTVLGNADAGSFDAATGLVTLRLADARLDQAGRSPGQDLTNVNVRTYLARPDAGQKSQNNASDISANGTYHLAGNASCFCAVDHAPTAGLSASPTSGDAPLDVTFDGSSSFDPDVADGDGVATYTFTFADGTPPVTQSTPIVHHTYTLASGPSGYYATLTVTDQKCAKASVNVASVNIRVSGGATPVVASLVDAKALQGRVSLKWYSPEPVGSPTVYRQSGTDGWQTIGRVTPDGSGMMVFEDSQVTAGTRYGYRLGIVQDGRESFYGETWVTVPGVAFGLTALGNPSRGATNLTLGLDRAGSVRVLVFGVDGRRVAELLDAWMPVGTHAVHWDGRDAAGGKVAAGVYMVRARTGSRETVARVTLLP
jgi:hypothetical protein